MIRRFSDHSVRVNAPLLTMLPTRVHGVYRIGHLTELHECFRVYCKGAVVIHELNEVRCRRIPASLPA